MQLRAAGRGDCDLRDFRHVGRPVVAGWIRHPDDRFRPALVRLRNSLIFANGFETGGLLAWRDVF